MKFFLLPLFVVFLLFLVFSIQISQFSYFDYTDKLPWQEAVSSFSLGHLATPEDATFGYPGMTLLWLGKIFVKSGIEVEEATTLSISILTSLLIFLCTLLVYLLRKESYWWVATFGILMFDKIYTIATPPSTIVSLLSVASFLLILLFSEKKIPMSTFLVSLGILDGLALLTRFDISLALIFLQSLFLFRFLKLKTVYVPLLAFLLFCLGDPHMWHEPIKYLAAIFEKINLHAREVYATQTFLQALVSVPIALWAFAVGSTLFLFKKDLFTIPRDYYIWLLLTTGFIFAGLIVSASHPIWYFFPVLLFWELLLPLFLSMIFVRISIPYLKNLQAIFTVLIVFAQGLTFLYMILLST